MLKPALSVSDSVLHCNITSPALGVAVKEESSITVGGVVVVVDAVTVVVVEMGGGIIVVVVVGVHTAAG